MTLGRENPAPLKVIGVGLGRTGTLSLHTALQILGFGPCHHPIIEGVDTDQLVRFANATKNPSPEVLDDLYRGYVSAVDVTTAILAEPLYKAFPDAKFILTVRDPNKWVQSMKKTTLVYFAEINELEARIASGTATEEDHVKSNRLRELGSLEWGELYQQGYHKGRLATDLEGEFLRHKQFITELIPSEKLLIFDVAEGWGPLAKFLEVPEPKEPMPRLNDTAQFETTTKSWSDKIGGTV